MSHLEASVGVPSSARRVVLSRDSRGVPDPPRHSHLGADGRSHRARRRRVVTTTRHRTIICCISAFSERLELGFDARADYSVPRDGVFSAATSNHEQPAPRTCLVHRKRWLA
ncbi:hypothetical protein DYB28_010303 [Aphanomyces astaci]|uniref:Uncharacterized protein n=1 Tax=Aphanomyces astaci TaxID=112090 RepID=A0A9X8HDM3_APHAT|nr:hypothetical protein DYB28_010303 [Aphanomyces astaci]